MVQFLLVLICAIFFNGRVFADSAEIRSPDLRYIADTIIQYSQLFDGIRVERISISGKSGLGSTFARKVLAGSKSEFSKMAVTEASTSQLSRLIRSMSAGEHRLCRFKPHTEKPEPDSIESQTRVDDFKSNCRKVLKDVFHSLSFLEKKGHWSVQSYGSLGQLLSGVAFVKSSYLDKEWLMIRIY
ncbi:hypothetical protein N9D31_01935 [Oligoflexaceae bacterium]|nr:hypothetical protein [Oligoflexaceae bacterium]